MNMKKIYRLGILAATCFAVTACEFLDVEPQIIPSDEFYKTEKEVAYGLAGVYGALNNEELYGNYYSLMISNTDDLCYQNREHNGAYVYWYNHNSSDPYVYSAWTMLYAGIKNANEFMQALTSPQFDKELDKDGRNYAEARFLRAYYHFLLAQAWGNVPLRTKPTLTPDDVHLAATPQTDVLKWCVSEMEEAWKSFDDKLDNAPSRISKRTIEGILARVYLFTAGATVKGVDSKAMYERAAYWAGQVVADGRVKLNPSYAQVFINMISDAYDRSSNESMWEAEFLGDRTNAQMWSNGRIGDMIGLQSTSGDNKYNEWNCNYSYAMYNGSLKLWDLYYTYDRTPEETENKAKLDARQEWNMPPYNYAGRKDNATGLYIFRPSVDKTPYNYDKISSFDDPSAAVCARNAGKWRREAVYEGHKIAKQLYTSINFPILRYSDVLLMYAEAVNESKGAPTQEAYDCVKRVRDRAGIQTVDFGAVGSYKEFQNFVRNERGRELAFEGLRKWDLIRWGIFVEAMNGYAKLATDKRWSKDANTSRRATETGTSVQARHIYLPIPSTELGVNKLLKQNPLW
ncbi:MAG: RagB/SusD family nutrient uptake outer membrane protein [Alistipes sp.]